MSADHEEELRLIDQSRAQREEALRVAKWWKAATIRQQQQFQNTEEARP